MHLAEWLSSGSLMGNYYEKVCVQVAQQRGMMVSIVWERSSLDMLTSEKPYRGNTIGEIAQQHLHKPVPKLPQRYCHWQFLLIRMMSKDKEGRYSAAVLLDVMRDLRI